MSKKVTVVNGDFLADRCLFGKFQKQGVNAFVQDHAILGKTGFKRLRHTRFQPAEEERGGAVSVKRDQQRGVLFGNQIVVFVGLDFAPQNRFGRVAESGFVADAVGGVVGVADPGTVALAIAEQGV